MITCKPLVLVPVVAFVALLLAGLVVSVLSLRAVTAQEWREMAELDKVLSGESTRRFTRLLNQNFVMAATFSRIERGINWNLTGDLGPGVRPGCDDWLFLTEELEIYPDAKAQAALRADIVAQLSGRLDERDIRLLVAVVPDKTRIENAHLCGLHRPARLTPRITDWLQAIGGRGIGILDLTGALAAHSGERYYRTDTHWNESGANVAARDVANRMAALQWADAPDPGAVTLNMQLVARSGDLVRLAGLDGLPGFLRPGVERASVTRVEPVVVESDDLFGDAGLPSIALIGTSYSRNSHFVPFLEHYLKQPVANLAREGGDFSGSAIEFFASAGFRDTPPQIVIWEIPERMLEKPVTQAERDWLARLKKEGL